MKTVQTFLENGATIHHVTPQYIIVFATPNQKYLLRKKAALAAAFFLCYDMVSLPLTETVPDRTWQQRQYKRREKKMNTNTAYEHFLKTAKYILQMRPVFNADAVFSDETENYVSPAEPEKGSTVSIRLRTAHNNIDDAYLISGKLRQKMDFEKTEGSFDYYTTSIKPGSSWFRYYFELSCGRIHCYYNKLGVTQDLRDDYSFSIRPGFHTPDWAKGAVMYQIFIDRFCNGDPENDVLDNEYSYINECVTRVTDWDKRPSPMDVREFYGGDLAGVFKKLDYLQSLGIDVIYFNPLFVSPSNHKYDIQDYDHIDPHLGHFVQDEGELLQYGDKDNTHATRYIQRVTRKENLESADKMFADLVSECHKRGIRVILDGVFNHCGSFNKWMDRERIYENQEGYEKGAYISEDSPYHSFFHFNNEHEWPYNPYYEGWWGHDTLPKLNYENSPKLEEYILNIGAKWVSAPYNADGWRLDVAADLGQSVEYNHIFWKKFRQSVKKANPNAIILAEHYGAPGAWLQGDEWDTVMNYDAFMEPLTWFFTGMEKHSDEFRQDMLGNAGRFIDSMRYNMAQFMAPSLQVAMNELSNHDHSRFLTRTNHMVGRMNNFDYDAASDHIRPEIMREAVVMQMTWPGAPTIYYGDEVGVCGFTDPDNRRTYPWGHGDWRMLDFHREAIRLHKKHRVFANGSLIILYGSQNELVYARMNSEEKIIVLFNNGDEETDITLRVFPAGIENGDVLDSIFITDAEGISRRQIRAVCENGCIQVHMAPTSAVVMEKTGNQKTDSGVLQ